MTDRSCATCVWADATLRDGELVMECHLTPPTTMPPAPPLPDATVTVYEDEVFGDEPVEAEVLAFAEPHRYPVVTDTDWCADHTPEETPVNDLTRRYPETVDDDIIEAIAAIGLTAAALALAAGLVGALAYRRLTGAHRR